MLLHRVQELSIILLLCMGVQWSFLMNGEYRSEVFVKCPTSRIDGKCKHEEIRSTGSCPKTLPERPSICGPERSVFRFIVSGCSGVSCCFESFNRAARSLAKDLELLEVIFRRSKSADGGLGESTYTGQRT
jgi:hypothetical protein